MSRVAEIERAILELTPEEFAEIAQRVHEIEQDRWDAQMDQDFIEGRLDFLIAEAKEQREKGLLRDWPTDS